MLTVISVMVWLYLQSHPTAIIADYVHHLYRFGLIVSPSFISRLFRRWSFSFKTPEYRMIYKYSWENLSYYFTYLVEISRIPQAHIHYLDEASYNPKDLRPPRIVGPVNQRQTATHSDPLDKVWNTTVYTSYSEDGSLPPVVVDIRQATNDSWSFLSFVIFLVNAGYLPPNHVLVIDNARVHIAAGILPILHSVLTAAQVRLILMPKYSPELSPAEFVHQLVKHYIRRHSGSHPLWQKIIMYHIVVTPQHMKNWYNHCLTISERPAFESRI
eukprot:TRINITY_DN6955_c0_g1_i1.p1 TRINITY_DN6955_c0_g1~~TRINITY_DN6955_c0_g1_i1.p1  ORF type:complete len:271 (+),score=41.16 TRINITY_DN6955_c0_g1_i1:339-1151(+)